MDTNSSIAQENKVVGGHTVLDSIPIRFEVQHTPTSPLLCKWNRVAMYLALFHGVGLVYEDGRIIKHSSYTKPTDAPPTPWEQPTIRDIEDQPTLYVVVPISV